MSLFRLVQSIAMADRKRRGRDDTGAVPDFDADGFCKVGYSPVPPEDAEIIRRASTVHNSDTPWNDFSSEDYWRGNYSALQPEDQEVIRLVSCFLTRAFGNRPSARRGIDVGSGANLYPALLMIPWAQQILLTDFSASNVSWLHREVADESTPWAWQPFWRELQKAEGYIRVGEPRRQLQEACASEPGYAGIEQRSVFSLPQARWDLGTMFFVAECLTEDRGEFRTALAGFVGALTSGAPLATAFMAGSSGYSVAGTRFPALPVTPDDVEQCFTELGVRDLSVKLLQSPDRVRPGYEGIIVATGLVGDR